MSVISTVRRSLRSISDWFAGPEEPHQTTEVPVAEALKVVDEAIYDPTMRTLLEQQPSEETLKTNREIISSPGRFNEFKEGRRRC